MTKTVTVDPEVAEKDTNGDGHISKQEKNLKMPMPVEMQCIKWLGSHYSVCYYIRLQ